MAGPKIDEGLFEALGKQLGDAEGQNKKGGPPPKPWSPSLGATQQKVFDSPARYLLISGNRGGGKTYVLGHKIVRHAYENFNALCLIIVGVRSQATQGGIWDKLFTEILPRWKDGIGLEYADERMDEQRYRFFMIRNRHGGWSKVTLMSVPYGASIRGRIRGFEPSFVFVDELTTLDTPDYFDAVVQQVGRRPGITGAQQYCAACNPDGPSHWVYRRFFELPYQESYDEKGKVVKREGEWDPDYQVFHLQMEENRDYLNPSYYKTVVEATRSDPIEHKRMVEGLWIDRPSGRAIFKDTFLQEIHVRGTVRNRVIPSVNFPLICGYDLGSVNNAIVFMQMIPTKEKVVWVVFDEMVYTNKKLSYQVLVRHLVRRMGFWNKVLGKPMKWLHISDNSAFNQHRAATGSYDVLDVERFSRPVASSFEGIDPIKMKAAPKFPGSVEARVRLTTSLLVQEQLVVSATCVKMIDMFRNLESVKVRRGDYDPSAAFKPKRSVHLHPFDAFSYPVLQLDVGSASNLFGDDQVRNEIIELV